MCIQENQSGRKGIVLIYYHMIFIFIPFDFFKNKMVTIRKKAGVPIMAQWLANLTSIHEERRFDPGPHSVG